MKAHLQLFSSLALAGAAITPVGGEVIFTLSSARSYLQTSRSTFEFEGGDLFINMRDGNAILSPCPHPSPTIIPPSLPCPIGTTGFIADGDLDGDGTRNDLSFWSITDVIPAFVIEPFRPELLELVAAPPSELPRPLGTFSDQGALIFFNVLTANVRQFNISQYSFARNYPEGPIGWSQTLNEIKIGEYRFTFPLLGDEPLFRPVPIAITVFPIPDMPAASTRFPDQAFQFTSGAYDADGNYLMDPRLTNRIAWKGNNPQNSFPAVDQYRLSIIGEVEDEETGELVEGILFPPSATAPILIDNPFTSEYLLPPFFFEIGDEALFRLRYERALGTTNVAFDTSARLFHLNLRFVDSYAGDAVLTFPSGNTQDRSAPTGDFDEDGFTNLEEFALQTDPTDADDVPVLPGLDSNIDGTVFAEVPKRPNAALVYSLEISENDGRFVEIKEGDATWDIVEDSDDVLRIATKLPADPATFKVRLKVRNLDLSPL